MKVLILLSVVAGALAFLDCPENQHYEECGTACPLRCDNVNNPPMACTLQCVTGCFCDKGYVKNHAGKCVLPEECPANELCGVNQDYKECGTACPLTCENHKNPPKICPAMCVIGCQCSEGYVKRTDGRCVKPERCPTTAGSSCDDEPETGLCRAYFPMWYYDKTSGSCKEFVYGGCGGNGNRYASKEKCQQQCAPKQALDRPDCDKPAETGMCMAYFERFFYDQEAGMCKKFVYGGCGGNRNNFETEDECYNKCGALAPPNACAQEKEVGPCRAAFPRFFFNKQSGQCEKFIYGGCRGNENNFGTQEECEGVCLASAPSNACVQEKVVGPCRAAFRRFFFNKQSGKCEKFIYGGCRGNDNNFGTQEECEGLCLGKAAPTACAEEKVVGPCKAAFPRYFFNKETGKCEKFTYGGCGGNSNNFGSQEDCEDVCLA